MPQKWKMGCSDAYVGSTLSRSFFYDGLEFKVIASEEKEGIVLAVALELRKDLIEATVITINQTNRYADVRPGLFQAVGIKSSAVSLPLLRLEKVASKAGAATFWESVAIGMNRSATRTVVSESTHDGTVRIDGQNGRYDGTSTTYTKVPDYAARERAQQQLAEIEARKRVASSEILSTGLKDRTLLPGDSYGGKVFFGKGKGLRHLVVIVPIDGARYEFPFDLTKP